MFLCSHWRMSDRLKYSYSFPLRTAWQMSQNFHASVGYCCLIWLVKPNNTRTRPMLITPSLNIVDAILLHVCTVSFSMSEWSIFPFFCFHRLLTTPSIGLNFTWPLCCPRGAHTLYFNVLSVCPCGAHNLYFIVLSFVLCVCCCSFGRFLFFGIFKLFYV